MPLYPPASSSSAAVNSSQIIQNLGLLTSIAANAMTIALKQADGTTDPAAAPANVSLSFRSATATSGAYNIRSVTSALSIVIPSGASLGQVSGMNQYVWIYALDNAGTVELAVSGVEVFADGSIQSTTAISAGATSGSVLYSTTARTNVPIRIIGRALVNEVTAGTWASNASTVTINPLIVPTITSLVAYTPVFTGLGTVAASSFYSCRIGSNLRVIGSYTTGTPTAVIAQIALGFNGTSGNVTIAPIAVPLIVGKGDFGSGSTGNPNNFSVIASSGTTTMTFGYRATVAVPISSQNGNALAGAAETQQIFADIPILGWSAYGP